uniref:Uncharacterized protein n=1 Tax=Nelumbo nucifera TaxID=4432 RepID=A0A822ZFJ6_NELNU|nr:TPA_asm: hypothetical protein HUJ06_001877 [Nelumbo nucifera]
MVDFISQDSQPGVDVVQYLNSCLVVSYPTSDISGVLFQVEVIRSQPCIIPLDVGHLRRCLDLLKD